MRKKRKGLLIGCLALSTAICAGTAVIAGQSTSEPTVAVADESKTELTISAVSYQSTIIAEGYGGGILATINFSSTSQYFTSIPGWQGNVLWLASDGTQKTLNSVEYCGNNIAINRKTNDDTVYSNGDILFFKAGFTVDNYELKADSAWQYNGSSWTAYTGEIETETTLTIVTGGTYTYDVYSSNATSYGASFVKVQFNTAKTFTTGTYAQAATPELIEYKRANGDSVTLLENQPCTHIDRGYFIVRLNQNDKIQVGDVLTFKKGFALAGKETLANDMSFIVLNADGTDEHQLAVLPEVKSASLTLDGKIGLNFKFQMESGLTSEQAGLKVVFKKGETVLHSESAVGKAAESSGKYSFGCPILPQNYQDVITAELQTASGEKLISADYSIAQYADAIASDSSVDANAKNLVAAAKNYCEAARAWLAHEDVALDQTAVDLSAYAATASGAKPNGITNLSASLVLDAGTEIRVYLYGSIDGLTCKVNGTEQTPTAASEGKWYISYASVGAHELGNAITFEISDGTNTASLTYSALSYAHDVLGGTISNGLNNVLKAMYAYSEAAKTYLGK